LGDKDRVAAWTADKYVLPREINMSSHRSVATTVLAALAIAVLAQCKGVTADSGDDACGALEACCSQSSLPVADQSVCTAVANAGLGEACQSSLTAYASYCLGGGSPGGKVDASAGGSDSGHASSRDSGRGSGSGSDASVHDDAGTACQALAACCTSASMPANQVSACFAEANAGNLANCEAAHSSYESQGDCAVRGGGTGSGSGTGRDSGTDSGMGNDGEAGGMCVSFCATDSDCSSSCPMQLDTTQCCDVIAHVCYEISGFTCPVSSPDAGGGDGSIY
jgi:hypothetical protein